MKVVVVKGSKFWGFVLRKMFHIKKEASQAILSNLSEKASGGFPLAFLLKRDCLLATLEDMQRFFSCFFQHKHKMDRNLIPMG